MIDTLCTAFWVPSRAIHIIRCYPHPESFVWWNDFSRHTDHRQALSRACVRTARCFLFSSPSRSWQLLLSGREVARKNKNNLRSAQGNEWNPDSGELDNNWDFFTLTSPYKSPCTSVCVTQVWVWLWRCRCDRWSHHSLSCHLWECHSCHWWSQDEELHLVGLSVHVERMKMTRNMFLVETQPF